MMIPYLNWYIRIRQAYSYMGFATVCFTFICSTPSNTPGWSLCDDHLPRTLQAERHRPDELSQVDFMATRLQLVSRSDPTFYQVLPGHFPFGEDCGRASVCGIGGLDTTNQMFRSKK